MIKSNHKKQTLEVEILPLHHKNKLKKKKTLILDGGVNINFELRH